MNTPRLRDSNKRKCSVPFELSQIPEELIIKLGGYFIYLIYSGRKDFQGNDFGDAFADAIGGTHLASPLGIADVEYKKIAWSVKTVKLTSPFNANSVRLISGRCSPDYSYGINDPHEDIQKTGTAVLNIWNERINIAHDNYTSIRVMILGRSSDLSQYVLFEDECQRYKTSDYIWKENKNGNLTGFHKKTNTHMFTWQPHGSQFTIHKAIPETAKKFSIKLPPVLNKDDVLKNLQFDPSWISIL